MDSQRRFAAEGRAEERTLCMHRGPEPWGKRWGIDVLAFRNGEIVCKDSYWKRVERPPPSTMAAE